MKPWTPSTATTSAPRRSGPGKSPCRDPVDEPVDAECERGERAEHPEQDPGGLDRLRPEAREHVQGEPGEAQRRVARGAVAGRVPDVHLDDRGAAREDERLRELLPADRAEHRLDRVAPIRVERAAEVGDVDAREAAQHPVDQPRGHGAAPRVVARAAPSACDVVARLDRLDEARHVLGRVLQVAVHRHDDRPAGPRESRVHRRMLACVSLQPDRAHPLVAVVDALRATRTSRRSTRRRRRAPRTCGRTPRGRRVSRACSSSSVACSWKSVTTTESSGRDAKVERSARERSRSRVVPSPDGAYPGSVRAWPGSAAR